MPMQTPTPRRPAPGPAGGGGGGGGGGGEKRDPSSRLCVKNVPKYASEKRVKEFFAAQGQEVTDAKVLKTAAGVPRQVAFVGFRTVDDASKALKYFNRSYFDTCRLSIDFALPFGDKRLERAGKNGKRRREAGDAAGDNGSAPEAANDKKKRKNGQPEDKKLAEFLKLMQPRRQQQFWADEDNAGNDEAEDEDEDEDDDSDDEVNGRSNENEDASDEKTDERADNIQKSADGERKAPSVAVAAESGRLFVRNLCFDATEDDLEAAFSRFGPLAETHIPKDESGRSRGFGYVTFMIPEHAVAAIGLMDMQIFQGRLLHVMPALEKVDKNEGSGTKGSGTKEADDKKATSYKAKKEAERKEQASDSRSWNALFVRGDAAVGAVAEQLGMGKSDLLLGGEVHQQGDKTSAAVRMALSETRVIAETKAFLADEGVDVELLEQGVRDPASVKRSKDTFLVKNLPAETDKAQLRQMFARFGDVEKFVVPPSKTMALVQYFELKNAKRAFRGMAYKRYKRVPIYLEWAPANVLNHEELARKRAAAADADVAIKAATAAADEDADEAAANAPATVAIGDDQKVEDRHTLFVKNLNFETRETGLRQFFERAVGKENVMHVSIPRKNGRDELSMGFGFVEFKDDKACRKALRKARGQRLDDHELEVSISKRAVDMSAAAAPRGAARKQTSKPTLVHADAKAAEEATKIIVRNLAFEANRKELRQLVSAYGQVNSIRIPKKPDGSHRGFAFVDFVTHQEARTAFAALTNTHFYGRHLVLEWAEDNTSMEAMREKAAKAIEGH